MKKKLFGNNITTDCSYCENSIFENGAFGCKKNRTIKNGKCRKFTYDPLMRVPVSISLKGNYSAEDFRL